MSAITRETLHFRPMSSNQGRFAALPNGGYIYDWDQRHFAVDISHRRFTRTDVHDVEIAAGPTLRDVLPELADDAVVERLRIAGRNWTNARTAEREAAEAAREAIIAAAANGVAETRIAKIAGVDRMTVRRALGKLH